MEDPTALLDTDAALGPLLQVAQEASAIANVSTLRAVILKALSHPDIFCGYDQLKVLAVAANLDDAPLLQTLDLFSYGTYSQYAGTTTTSAAASSSSQQYYLSLTDAQLLKLRQLTVLSCVQDACCGRGDQGKESQQSSSSSSLSYASIAEALQLTDRRSMEQVVISCIYSRVLNAALCQKTQQVLLTTVPPCSSRDVPLRLPSTTTTTTTHHQPLLVQDLLDRLRWFEQRLAVSHRDLETAHTDVSQSLEQSAAAWKSVQDHQMKAQAQASSNSSSTIDYSSSTGATGTTGGAGAGGTVRLAGWPDSAPSVGQRRSSASRQSKRSRGGLGGSFTEPFQRF
jgi:hypothetical protein